MSPITTEHYARISAVTDVIHGAVCGMQPPVSLGEVLSIYSSLLMTGLDLALDMDAARAARAVARSVGTDLLALADTTTPEEFRAHILEIHQRYQLRYGPARQVG